MIISLVILIVSLLAMITMLSGKLYELKAGRQVVAVGLRGSFDKHTHQVSYAIRDVIRTALTKHFWTGLFTFAGRKFMEKVWRHPKVQTVTKKATDVVRGKKEIKSTGPVSFYLKDVSDYKKEVRSQ